MTDWTYLTDRLPDEDAVIEATTPTGDVRVLRRMGSLFFDRSREVYMYFTPVKWRYLDEG